MAAAAWRASGESPFEAALHDALSQVLSAHGAAVSTLEAELQHMRAENTVLRMRLSEVEARAIAADSNCGSSVTTVLDIDQVRPPDVIGAGAAVPTMSATTGLAFAAAPGRADCAGVPVVVQEWRPVSGQVPTALPVPQAAQSFDRDPSSCSTPVVPDECDQQIRTAAPPHNSGSSQSPGRLVAVVGAAGPPTVLGPDERGPPQAAPVSPAPRNNAAAAAAPNPEAAHPGSAGLAPFPVVVLPVQPAQRSVEAEGKGIAAPETASGVAAGSAPHGAPAASMPPAQVAPAVTAEVIEVITPGASAAMATSPAVGSAKMADQGIEQALHALLASHGWQNLQVQRLGPEEWIISGLRLQLRCDAGQDIPSKSVMASGDHGCTWEPLESLIRQRRLHQARPGPPHGTTETPAQPVPEGPQVMAFGSDVMSLADLARMGEAQSKSAGRPAASPTGADNRSGGPPGPAASAHVPPPTGSQRARSPSGPTHQVPGALLPLGPDGLPTHRHDGLPCFNNAFPTYFDALSGPKHYYNQFRIPGPRPPG